MKRILAAISPLFLCFIVLGLVLSRCNNKTKTSSDATVIKYFTGLLNEKEFFKLKTAFDLSSRNLDDKDKLYFRSFIDNAFNRNIECIVDVDSLLANFSDKLQDSVKSALARLQADSYFKTGQYAKAAQNDSNILKRYKRSIAKDDMDDIKNDLVRFSAISKVPPQQIRVKSNTTIPWKKDKIGLIEIPLKSNGQTFSVIFDTRANLSSVTQTYARKLCLRILDASYNESSGATGLVFKTGIAIADSMRIGNIIARNVVFQVMPDSILYIAPIKFQLNIILGLPLIEQLHEVDLFKDGRLLIPSNPSESNLHNLALDNLDPIISLRFGKDTLSFDFDSGAVTSDLYAAFFEKYKNQVLKNATKKLVEFGGAGGSKKKEVYILPTLALTVGDQTATIDSINVQQKKMYTSQTFYGNLGQDFIGNFKELVLNFKYMYVKGMK